MRFLRSWLALGLALAVAGCFAPHVEPAPQVPRTAAAPFTVTFWCGPPLAELTDARAAEIAAAGFNLVGSPCEGDINRDLTLRALDVAARHGLRLSVADPRFSPSATEHPGWESRLAAAVADYRTHPALGNYFVDDEPTAAEFGPVGAVVDKLRAADPAHFAYVNLPPDFVKPEVFGADSYEQYVERFIDTVHPQLLSYDYYPFRKDDQGNDQNRQTFFSNLTLIRDQALQHHLPFMLIVLAMPHGHYRDPTEAELRWQVFHALAFGARGISYFAYWTPLRVEGADKLQFRYGLIEGGRPTLHYFQVARLNQELWALEHALAGFRSLAVADSLGEVAPPLPVGPLEAIAGGPVTVGLFGSAAGQLAALLVNRDDRYGVTVSLRLWRDERPPELFDATTERWHPATASALRVAPGDAQLLRWK